MKSNTASLIFLALIASATAFNWMFIAKNLLDKDSEAYKKKILEIPKKITSKIKEINDKTTITTSYFFPPEYKTTLYKDYAQETTLVNVFPRMEISTQSLDFQTLDFQTIEPSTTFVVQIINSTVAYQSTPMINSTLTWPNTVPVQSIGYATQEFQHEILLHPTRVTVSEFTSTTTVNFTHISEVENNIPIF